MKCFLIFLAISLTSSEKLDRTYLPPPGAQFAGGNPGDILAPLEPPNGPETGSITTDSIPSRFKEFGSKEPLLSLPVTTTSYAFSQTTTFPSVESYETTVVPINHITGFPGQNIDHNGNVKFNQQFPIQSQGDYNYGSNIQPGFLDQTSAKINQKSNFNPDKNNFDQYSNLDGTSQPVILIPGNIPQISQINEQNGFPQQGLSTVSTQANVIIPEDQYGGIGSQGVPSESISQDHLYRPIEVNTIQPSYNQEYQNQGSISNLIPQQQFLSENPSRPRPEPVFEKKTYQPGQNHNDGYSSTPRLSSTASAYSPGSNINRPERPQNAVDRNAVILNFQNVRTPNGYSYSYDTSNGIHADETGIVDDGTKAQGSYSYTGDDGKIYSVFYTADENGFQPHGDHLPTPPPIPEAIKKVIEQVAREKAAGIIDDGSYDENKYGYEKYHNFGKHRRPEGIKPGYENTGHESGITDDNYDRSEPQNLFPKNVNIDFGKKMSTNNYLSQKGSNKNENDDTGHKNIYNDGEDGLQFTESPQSQDSSSDQKLPVSRDYDSQPNIFDTTNRYPVNTSILKDTTTSKIQYPGLKYNNLEEKLKSGDYGDRPLTVNDKDARQPSSPGQASAYPNDNFSEISSRRPDMKQTGDNNNISGLITNKYVTDKPQTNQDFNEKNRGNFNKKQMDIPYFENDQQSNNPQNTNQMADEVVNKNGYYYNQPQYQLENNFPTRINAEEFSSTPKPTYATYNKITTPRPFSSEKHNQFSKGKQASTPQPFMTSRVTSPGSYFDYENDEDYTFERGNVNEDINNTKRPSAEVYDGTHQSYPQSQTVTQSDLQTLPNPTPSQTSRFASPDIPQRNTKQFQRPTSVPSNNFGTSRTPNYNYQTERPVPEDSVVPSYGTRIISKPNELRPQIYSTSTNRPVSTTTLQTTPKQQAGSDNFRPSEIPGTGYQPVVSNTREPNKYLGIKKPSTSDRPSSFILSEPRTSPNYQYGVTTPGYTTTIASSTPPNYNLPNRPDFPGSQTVSRGYNYEPPKSVYSTTALPSTIRTTPEFYVSSTEPSHPSQVHSVTQQQPENFSKPDTYDQNALVDGFGRPITSEFQPVFLLPDQETNNFARPQFSGEDGLKRPEDRIPGSVLLGDSGKNPTYNIDQSPRYPEYNNQGKITGEHFSGPKQPQRYDSQTGYHYK